MLSSLEAKLISVTAVSIGSYIFGFLPALLQIGSRFRKSTFLSFTLCFGAGVLLATSIVHILPDIQNDINQWGEIFLCIGFLLIYLIDVLSSTCSHQEVRVSDEQDALSAQGPSHNYGTIESGFDTPFSAVDDSLEIRETNQWSCLNFGLLIAFTIHALLEGLVIGIQNSTNDVLLLLGAVCSHKLLVAFCLGAEIISDGRPWRKLFFPLSVFVLGSDLGIIFGMIFEIDGSSTTRSAIPYIEAIAGGTLLYIALCEIVPRERSRKLPRYAAIFQFIGMLSGFFVMSALCVLI